MNIIGVTSILVALLCVATAWPEEEDDYSAWRLARTSRRSHHCVGSGNKCFSTSECCRGFVCAAFDDYFGQRGVRKEGGRNPEIPGFCVKEKDLQPCFSHRDCEENAKCVSLGRTGENYCVKKPEPPIEQMLEQLPIINVPSENQIYGTDDKAGLGTNCETSADCSGYDKASGDRLCCQRVSRGRQGPKHICDRVTEISKCIAR